MIKQRALSTGLKMLVRPGNLIAAASNNLVKGQGLLKRNFSFFIKNAELSSVRSFMAVSADELFLEGKSAQIGDGEAINYVKAARCYQQAIDKGHVSAHQNLAILLCGQEITGEALHEIGKMYYRGKEIQNRSYQQAKWCFEEASKKGQSISDYKLAVMYRRGWGVDRDLIKASQYYIRAVEKGYKPMDMQKYHDALINDTEFPSAYLRTQARAFEKALITGCFISSKFYPNTQDKQGNTLLHRSSRKKYYKHCARLMIFGADKNLKNSKGEVPFASLTTKELEKINELQFQLLDLRKKMNLSVPEVLARQVCLQGATADHEKLKNMFGILESAPDIQPLLALAKLAALGLHDLAYQESLNQTGYDSDEEVPAKRGAEKLSFIFDASHDHVQNILHYGSNGQQGREASGIYSGRNRVYIAAKASSFFKMHRIIIHELTHFLAQEIFKNECKPYFAKHRKIEKAFLNIINDVRNQHFSKRLPKELATLAEVFSFYPERFWPAEFIARVPEIIVEHGEFGKQKLVEMFPALYDFYHDHFLVQVQEHTARLKARALSDWNEALFCHSESSVKPRF